MSSDRPDGPTLLADLAALVRSKNAGPFWLTIDLMFRDDDGYERACRSPRLAADALAALLKVDVHLLRISRMDAVRAIKVSLPRVDSAGSPRDRDALGGQQYASLLELAID
jgi:hypothetical protein